MTTVTGKLTLTDDAQKMIAEIRSKRFRPLLDVSVPQQATITFGGEGAVPCEVLVTTGDGEEVPAVVVTRERFERIAAVAELAHEWVNAPEDSSIGRRAEDALTHAVDALQSGDLDPLT